MRRLWHWATSFPMSYMGRAFRDRVTGEEVCYFEDRHGRQWMGLHRWDIARVERVPSNPAPTGIESSP